MLKLLIHTLCFLLVSGLWHGELRAQTPVDAPRYANAAAQQPLISPNYNTVADGISASGTPFLDTNAQIRMEAFSYAEKNVTISLASAGDADALYELGLSHLYGVNSSLNQNVAERFFFYAAEKGQEDAARYLAFTQTLNRKPTEAKLPRAATEQTPNKRVKKKKPKKTAAERQASKKLAAARQQAATRQQAAKKRAAKRQALKEQRAAKRQASKKQASKKQASKKQALNTSGTENPSAKKKALVSDAPEGRGAANLPVSAKMANRLNSEAVKSAASVQGQVSGSTDGRSTYVAKQRSGWTYLVYTIVFIIFLALSFAAYMFLSNYYGLKAAVPEDFNKKAYLDLNPDVKAARIGASYHYLKHGKAEGRQYKY